MVYMKEKERKRGREQAGMHRLIFFEARVTLGPSLKAQNRKLALQNGRKFSVLFLLVRRTAVSIVRFRGVGDFLYMIQSCLSVLEQYQWIVVPSI